MAFKDTGLPNDKLVEQAYEHGRSFLVGEKMLEAQRIIAQREKQYMTMLEQRRQSTKNPLTDAQYEAEKKKITEGFARVRANLKTEISRQLEEMFNGNRVQLAKMLNEDGNAAPELLASALLVDCIRTPADYNRLKDRFGTVVADILSEVHEIVSYESERARTLTESQPAARRLYFAVSTQGLLQMIEEIKKIPQQFRAEAVELAPDFAQQHYNELQLVSPCDAALEAKYIAAFNEVMKETRGGFRIDTLDSGKRVLVEDNAPPALPPIPPKTGGKPSGPGGSLGGDIF